MAYTYPVDHIFMEGLNKKLSQKLLDSGAIKFGDFVLTSGKHSKYYVDIKDAATNPEILSLISEILVGRIGNHKIAGVELGAVPILVATAVMKGLPYLIIRKERKHGTGKLTIGEITPGEEIEIIEDVVTTGGSIMKAVNYLRENGAIVNRAYCVVDREEGGKELLDSNNVRLEPLIRISEIMPAGTP
jgi:orotate phosphoribosyltransferase